MADFELAVKRLSNIEGGFVDHPNDHGGATNWGISSRWLSRIGDPRDVRDLTKADAEELYRVHFWDRYNYGDIDSQDVAYRVFDASVNMGPSWAHKVLQRALRASGIDGVDDDGVIGSITLNGIKRMGVDGTAILLAAMRSEQAGRYREILAKDPTQSEFIEGWLARAYGELS